MNPSIYLVFFFILMMLYITMQEDQDAAVKLMQKKKGSRVQMEKMLQHLIGEDCLITTLKDTRTGVLTEVSATSLLLVNKDITEIINLDYVINVRQHSKNKQGKKKFFTLT